VTWLELLCLFGGWVLLSVLVLGFMDLYRDRRAPSSWGREAGAALPASPAAPAIFDQDAE
jgi:hypothetical protein